MMLAEEAPEPAGRRLRDWPARLATAPGGAARRTLLLGAAALSVPVLLAVFDVAGRVAVWENAHWILAAVVAFTTAALGTREAEDALDRRVRVAFAVGLAALALGQVAFAAQVATDFDRVPGPSAVLTLVSVVPMLYGLFVAVRQRVPPATVPIVLDAGIWVVAVGTAILAGYGPQADSPTGWIRLAHPVVFLATAGIVLTATLVMRVGRHPGGAYLLIGGLAVLGVYWLASLSAGLTALPPAGAPINYLASAGMLLVALGAASWSSVESESDEFRRWARALTDLLPLGAVVLAAAFMVLPAGDNATLDYIDAGALMLVALAVIRQVLLLKERSRIVASEREARQQALGALVTQRAADDREKTVAEVFKHLSDRITFAGDESDLVQAAAVALGRLVPSSAGNLLLIDESEDRLRVAAAWGGPGAGETGTLAAIARPSLCPGIRRGSVFLAVQVADEIAVRCRGLGVSAGSVMCVPMLALGTMVGVVHLGRPEADAFDAEDQRLAVGVAEQVALAIANARLMKTMEGLAMTDPLTHLNNARFFDPYLERQLALSGREGKPVGMIMIDLDHFKQFNDTYGHQAGDEALRTFSRTVLSALRESDTVARYGGEEFVVALPSTDLKGTFEAAEKVRKAVEKTPIEVGPGRFARITVSQGVVCSTSHGSDRLNLVRAADRALYRAKQLGRNRTAVPEPRQGPEGWGAGVGEVDEADAIGNGESPATGTRPASMLALDDDPGADGGQGTRSRARRPRG